MTRSLCVTVVPTLQAPRPYAAPTQARGEMKMFLIVPAIWRKKTQRVILDMMCRHPEATFTDIATMIFARGVEVVSDEEGRHQRRRADDCLAEYGEE